MPFNIGPGELIILLVIALVVFGPGRLPEVGQALGKSIREFRRAASDITESTNPNAQAASTATPPPAVAPPAAPPVAAAPVAAPAVPPPPATPVASEPTSTTTPTGSDPNADPPSA
jgi:TatA/E family protein of Tat protein translocase